MILINKKQVDPNTKMGKWVSDRIAYYSKLEKPIEFESYLEKQPKRFLTDETGKPIARREEAQGVWIGSQERFTIPGIDNVIINWVRDLPDIQNGEYVIKRALIGVEKGRLKVYPQKEPDKAFFLCEVSSVVRNGEVKIVDRAADDQAEVDKFSNTAFVEYMIAHKSSPIAPEVLGSEELIRTLAAGWGVLDSENKPLSTIRKELIVNVKRSNANKELTKRGFDEFIKDISDLQKGGNNDVRLRKDIQLAVERKLLAHQDNKVIMFPGKSIEKELLRHRPTETDIWIDKTIDLLKVSPVILKELHDELYFEETMTIEDKKRNFDNLNLTNKIEQVKGMRAWPQILKIYKEDCGLSESEIPTENKVSFLKEKIIEHYQNAGV